MTRPYTTQCTVRAARQAIPLAFGCTPSPVAAAVQKALLSGFAFSALVVVTSPVLAQTGNMDVATSEKQSASPAAAEVVTLPTVTVKGDAAMPTYSGGQVSTGGRMGFLGDKDFMETPFSATAYTEQFMADQQAQDIQKVIAKTDPSVFLSGVPGESNESYSIRGLPSSVGDVTLNGLAGMAAYYRNAPEMFERVEVLRGPSAMLGGMPPKGSAGGSVNLVTKRAGAEPLARLTTRYQSDAHFGGHIDLGRRFGDDQQFGIRFNGLYRNGETAVKTQDQKASLASLGLDWRGARARISADLYHSADRVYGMTRGLSLAPGVPVPKPPKPDISWNPPWAFYDTTDKGGMLRGEFDLSEQLMVHAAAGMTETGFSAFMASPQVMNTAGDFQTNFSGVSDTWKHRSGEVGLQGKGQTGSVGHQFALNATHYDEDYRLNGFRTLGPSANWTSNIYHPAWGPEHDFPKPPAISRTKTSLTSVGMANTLSFVEDRLQLTLGVRRQNVITDNFNGATGARIDRRYDESSTTPAAAFLLKATGRLSLYVNYSEGLSQGAIAPNTAVNAGEVFAPYKTKQKEIGLKLDLGAFAHTFSLYEIKRPGSFVDPVSNVFAFGGEQRNRGVEWGYFGTPMRGVRLMGGIAYSDAEVTKAAVAANEGKQATGLPKWQAKLGAQWDVPAMPGITLTANATAASKQYLNADNSLSVPGRAVYDLGARHATRLAGHPLTLRAAVTNLTNKAYWAKPHFTSLALGAPRTFLLSVTVDF